MTRSPKLIIILLSLATLLSCFESDDNVYNQLAQESLIIGEIAEDFSLIQLLEMIAGENSNVWKIVSLKLSNENVSDLDITSLPNVQDDSFVFTTNGVDELYLRWNKRLLFNENATDQSSVISDVRGLFDEYILSADSLLNFRDQEDSIFITLNQNKINGEILLSENSKIDFELVQKNQSNSATPPIQMENLTNLFSFQTENPEVGFKYTFQDNGLYLSNKLNNSTQAQVAFFYSLNNNQLESTFFDQPDYADKEIEFIDDKVYSISGQTIQVFNPQLIGDFTTLDIPEENWSVDFGTTAIGEDLYFLTGDYEDTAKDTSVNKYVPSNSSFETLAQTGHRRRDADGEILDDNIYIFGGVRDSAFEPLYGHGSIFRYSFVTGSAETLPASPNLTFTHTGIYNDFIYITGKRPISETPPIELINFLGAYDAVDDTYYPINLNLGVYENHDIIHVQINENRIFLVVSAPITNSTNFEINVIAADLY